MGALVFSILEYYVSQIAKNECSGLHIHTDDNRAVRHAVWLVCTQQRMVIIGEIYHLVLMKLCLVAYLSIDIYTFPIGLVEVGQVPLQGSHIVKEGANCSSHDYRKHKSKILYPPS